jgi:hypothetical protein
VFAHPPAPVELRAVATAAPSERRYQTRRSRRTVALPSRCVEILRNRRAAQDRQRTLASARWTEFELVFASETGTELDAADVRAAFCRVLAAAGLPAKERRPGAAAQLRVPTVRQWRHRRPGRALDGLQTRRRPWSPTLDRVSDQGLDCGRYWDRTSDLFGVNSTNAPNDHGSTTVVQARGRRSRAWTIADVVVRNVVGGAGPRDGDGHARPTTVSCCAWPLPPAGAGRP